MYKQMVCCLVLAFPVHAQPAAPHESFLAQPVEQKTNRKKKKSLATMRQEFVELAEQYAHTLIEELFVLSSVMMKKLSAAQEKELCALVHKRHASLRAAESFFARGDSSVGESFACAGELPERAWQLVQQYARVQEKLLYAISDLVEQQEKSCFMTADKQKLQTYQDSLHSIQKESELVVKELRGISFKATLKT